MMNRYLQNQILANRHMLLRKDCRSREVVISRVIPKCIYTTNKDEPLVDCVRCMRRFHFNCQYAKDNDSFNDAINDNFVDGTNYVMIVVWNCMN